MSIYQFLREGLEALEKAVNQQSEMDVLAEEAIENGEATDMLGEPLTKDDFVEISAETFVGYFLAMSQLMEDMTQFKGNILTIIDAVTEDKERAKFIKDVVKREFLHVANRMADNAQEGERLLSYEVAPLLKWASKQKKINE